MPLLVLLFIVVPIAELYVIIQVGQWIGVWPTLALLLADALLGSLLLRQQGRAAWQRFNAALAERRFPAHEVANGVMIVVGGTLLLTPGFITDIFGLLLLIPPTRAVIRGFMFRVLGGRFRLAGGVAGGVAGAARRRGSGGDYSDPASRPYDLEGQAREVPPNGDPAEEAADGPGRPPSLPSS